MLGKKEGGEQLVEEGAPKSDGGAFSAPEMPPTKMPDTERIDRYLKAAASKAGELNPQAAKYLEAAQPVILFLIQVVMFLAPWYKWAVMWCYKIYKVLPTNVLEMVFGGCLCFFGGTFVTSIAAVEAFRQMGWHRVVEDVKVVSEQAAALTLTLTLRWSPSRQRL